MSYTKRDIFPLKMAMERDGELSHGAARLGLLVCSHIYNDEQLKFRPHEPFALPWTLASKLCFGMCQKQIYRCERELVQRGYLIFESNGDRNTSHFRLALFRFSSDKNVHTTTDKNVRPSADKNVRPSADKNVRPSADKTARASSDKKGGPPSKLIPSEEIASSNERRNGSLRSAETNGNLMAASPEKREGKQKMTDAQRRRSVHALSQLRREIESDGKSKTKALLIKA